MPIQENSDFNTDCVVVIPSCDAYEDAWAPFFAFFFKYWPDCPFRVCLITEKKIYADPRVTTINLGQDFGWANNMLKVLGGLPEKYFIYFLEDVFITKKVDTSRVLELLAFLKQQNASCLRLFPSPGPDRPYEGRKDLGIIDQHAPYRVSTMTAIWDKVVFKNLLRAGENAWQMELDGTNRARAIPDLYLSVWPHDPAIDMFSTAIKRGKWQYDALTLCAQEGIPVVSQRPRESFFGYVTRRASYIPILGGFFRRGRRWYYGSRKKK